MADYIWTESAGTTCTVVPHVTSTKFGDGYSQDVPDGINDRHEEWDVVHTGVEKAILDEIEAFILPGLGSARFDWVPYGQTTARRFKCTSYRKIAGQEWQTFDVNLRFEQVFEP